MKCPDCGNKIHAMYYHVIGRDVPLSDMKYCPECKSIFKFKLTKVEITQ